VDAGGGVFAGDDRLRAGIIANFYRWCSERQVDTECEAGFNPAEKVRRPKVRRYREAKLLSQGELTKLLRTMRGDPSALGRRDYAFTLGRVRLGAAEKLQQLKWGQIEQEAEGRMPAGERGLNGHGCQMRSGRRYGGRWKQADG